MDITSQLLNCVAIVDFRHLFLTKFQNECMADDNIVMKNYKYERIFLMENADTRYQN